VTRIYPESIGKEVNTMIEARKIYAQWWKQVLNLTLEADEQMKDLPGGGEDLEDYIETIGALMSFGPNPNLFTKED
jgi:hypothetical protein